MKGSSLFGSRRAENNFSEHSVLDIIGYSRSKNEQDKGYDFRPPDATNVVVKKSRQYSSLLDFLVQYWTRFSDIIRWRPPNLRLVVLDGDNTVHMPCKFRGQLSVFLLSSMSSIITLRSSRQRNHFSWKRGILTLLPLVVVVGSTRWRHPMLGTYGVIV